MSPNCAGLDIFGGLLIARRAAALGSDLNDLTGLFDCGKKLAGVVHGVGGRLFNVGIAAGVHGFNTVQRVLEVSGRNEHCIDILARIEFFVVANWIHRASAELLDVGSTFFAAAIPNIGNGDELEVHLFGVLKEGGNQRALHAIAAADDTNLDAIIRTHDGGIAGGVPGDRGCGKQSATALHKIPAIRVLDCHVSP